MPIKSHLLLLINPAIKWLIKTLIYFLVNSAASLYIQAEFSHTIINMHEILPYFIHSFTYQMPFSHTNPHFPASSTSSQQNSKKMKEKQRGTQIKKKKGRKGKCKNN